MRKKCRKESRKETLMMKTRQMLSRMWDHLKTKRKQKKRKKTTTEEFFPVKKMRVELGRRDIVKARSVHRELNRTVETQAVQQSKGSMRSLIPRLLIKEKKQQEEARNEGRDDLAKEPERKEDDDATAQRLLALDHDYFVQGAAGDNMVSGDSKGGDQRITLETLQEAASTSAEEDASTEEKGLASPGGAEPVEVAQQPSKTSDSFITWLTIRGVMTQGYSKKPQSIHEDITLHRCSIRFKLGAQLCSMLEQHLVSTESALDGGQTKVSEEKPNQKLGSPQSCEQRSIDAVQESTLGVVGPCGDAGSTPSLSRITPSSGGDISSEPSIKQSVQDESNSPPTVAVNHPPHSLETTPISSLPTRQLLKREFQHDGEAQTSASVQSKSECKPRRTPVHGRFHTIGELLNEPFLPFRAFLRHSQNLSLRPVEEYSIKEPHSSLEDICSRNEQRDLLHRLYEHIKNGGRMGVTYPQVISDLGLHDHQSKKRAFSCLRILIREQLVLELGTVVLRLVALDCASCWLLKSAKVTYMDAPPSTTLQESMDLPQAPKKTKVMGESTSQPGGAADDQSLRDQVDEKTPSPLNECSTGQVLVDQSMDVEGDVLDDRTHSDSVMSDILALGQRVDSMLEGCEETTSNDKTPPVDVVDLSSGKETQGVEESVTSGSGDGPKGEEHSTKDDVDISNLQIAKEDIKRSGSSGRRRKRLIADEGTPAAIMKYEPVKVMCHIWTNIDGTVNLKSLHMFLSSMGLLVISKPGVKESDVFHHFRNVLAPVECFHLIKMLVNADIISRHATFINSKLSLFRPPPSTKPKPVVYYQPTAGAVINLALLTDNLAQDSPQQ